MTEGPLLSYGNATGSALAWNGQSRLVRWTVSNKGFVARKGAE